MEEEVKEEKEMSSLFLKKSVFVVIGLAILIFLAWYTRTVNVPNLKDITTQDYTLGPDLDPFLFLRYAKYIVENNKFMEHDSMRYVPLGYNTSAETKLLPYMIAYFHKIIGPFTNKSINYSAVIFPAFMFLLTVIAFFLFIRRVFENNKYGSIIAIVSSAFLIVSPSLLPRTVAGIPEKESVGFFFMFLAFYFFLSAWKLGGKKRLILASLSGISTGLMGLVWGGAIYVFFVITFAVFLNFVFGKIGKNRIFVFGLWIFLSIFMMVFFSERFTLAGLVVSHSSGSALMIFSLLLIDFLIFKTKIKNLKFIENLREKIPDRIISVLFSILFGVLFSSLFFGISFVPGFFKDIITSLTVPYTDRLSLTVAENRQPYFDEWKDSFGPVVKGVPLYFWLFLIGSVFLFYWTIKRLDRKSKHILTIAYIIFLFGLIFSRHSSESLMNGINFISKIVYFGSFLLFLISFVYLFYNFYKENKLDEFRKINSSYVFLLSFFIISLIGARSAVRLIMTLSAPAAGIVGFFFMLVIEKAKEQKNESLKLLFSVIALIVIFSSLYVFYFNYKVVVGSANAMVPSVYTHQWQKAMAWVRENTPKESVFSHWWDYGYWLQSIGNRASVLDGGNAIGYWNHLMGRHVLTGRNENEALEFLYSHNVTHLLIDSSEIGKYPAYSSIGSDENYDRYSWIGTFLFNERAIEEKRNETVYIYQGGVALDEDYVWKQNNEQIFFPSKKAGVGAIILTQTKDDNFKQPEAIFVFQGKQARIPLRYLYYKNKLYDFKEGYEGAAYVMPQLIQERGINNLGAALFLSERNMRALWVRLYLLEEGENFKLVHKQQDFVVESLKNQGLDVGDFVYYNGIRGPIKIWQVSYPSDIKFKEKYLDTYWPESVMLAKLEK